jgi:hypothetical protein
VSLADILTLVGLLVAVVLYGAQQVSGQLRDRDAAIALLVAVHDGIKPWGDLYFGDPYDEAAAVKRASQDYSQIASGNYAQVFYVPTEPLAALIASPAAGGLIGRDTVEAASVALWRIDVFNQLVRQQTDFNTNHLAEIRDDDLPAERREVLGRAAFSISTMLHRNGIGDALWYSEMMSALEANRADLEHRRGRWWRATIAWRRRQPEPLK